MVELWMKIDGYDNYQVSNWGRVKKKACVIVYKNGNKCFYKTKLLKPDIVKGYERVTLSKNNKQKRFMVHRLVAQKTLLNPDNKPCVNHRDGNKRNNHFYNLEWCTYSENERHSIDVLGKVNHNRKLSEEEVKDVIDNARKASYGGALDGNVKEYAKKYGVHIKVIHNILNRKYYV